MATEMSIGWLLLLMVVGVGASAAIGVILDVHYDMEARSIYWALGAIGTMPMLWYLLYHAL